MRNVLEKESSLIADGRLANMSFVAALLVVAVHIDPPTATHGCARYAWWISSGGFASIAVPFFFFVSGYFLVRDCDEAGWWSRAISKRIRTLLIPFVVWNTLFLVFDITLAILANAGSGRPLMTNCLKPIPFYLNAFGLNPLQGPILGALWYVRTLLLFVLLSPLFLRIVRSAGVVAIVCLFCLTVAIAPCSLHLPKDDGFGSLIYFLISPEGLTYFLLGVWSRLRRISVKRPPLWMVGFLIVLSLVLLVIRADFAINGLPWRVMTPFANALLLVAVLSLLPEKRLALPPCLGSFKIYVLHMFMICATGFALRTFDRGLFLLCAQYVLTLLLTVAGAWFLVKYMSRFSEVVFGKR